MGIGKVTLKITRALFANPFREGAKRYEQIPFALSMLYAGSQGVFAVKNITQNKDKDAKQNMLSGYVGIAAAAGSMLGPAGTILFGSGMYRLVNEARGHVV